MPTRSFYFYGDDRTKILVRLREWQNVFVKKFPEGEIIEREATKNNLSELGEIFQQVFSAGLFSRPQFLIIKNLFALGRENKEIIDYFFKYVLPQTATVVFIEDDEPTLSLQKKIKDKVELEEFALPQDKDLEKWLLALGKKNGLSASEIQQLQTAAGEGAALYQMQLPALALMKKYLSWSEILNIYFPKEIPEEMFPFLDGLKGRQILATLKAFNSFVLDDSTLIWLGGFIIWQANMLRLASLTKSDKKNLAEMAKDLKMKSTFPVESSGRSLALWPAKDIEALQLAGWTLLKKVKETKGEPAAYLHQIIMDFCR